jgi:hypothetical protein
LGVRKAKMKGMVRLTESALSNKRQSEVVQRKNMKTFNGLKTILD